MKKKKVKLRYFDYSLLFVIIFLLGFGLVMIYSTSSYNAQIKFNNAEFYFMKQLKAVIGGLVVMYLVYRMDYHIWRKFANMLYVIAFVCIFLVIPFGYRANGAKRWIGIGPVSFQPAELAKIAIIIFVAALVCNIGTNIKKTSCLLKIWFYSAVMALPILVITNNMSSAIIVIGIGVAASFIAYPHYKPFVIATGTLSAACIIFYSWLKTQTASGSIGFRLTRLMVWLDPEKYADGKGYQTVQSLYAIGSGGLFGKGLGKSLQKLGFIPEAQNDMIFSIICEELGLFGALCLMIVFAIMLWRFVYIAVNAPDLFGTLLVAGVFAHIAIQVILNIAVVTNMLPNTGISLPFISYGGTSVLFLLVEMGIVLNVSAQIRLEKV